MRVEYIQTKSDLIAFYQFDRWFSDDRKGFRLKTRLKWGAVATIPVWLLIFNTESDKINSVIGLILFVAFYFSLGFFAGKPAVLGRTRAIANKVVNDHLNKDFFEKIIFEFTKDSITWNGESSQGQSHIKSIKKVREDKNYFYLYNSSLTAYVIPKRIFRTEYELKEFEVILKNYRQQNSGTPT